MDERDRDPRDSERREHFRVEEDVLLYLESLDADTAARRRAVLREERFPLPFTLSSRLLEMRQETIVLRRHAQRESATFAKLIDQLDLKIDLLSEVLMLQDFGDRRPAPYTVDLAAEGMGLQRQEPLAIGTWLDLRMLFRSSGLGLRTFAEVMRCDAVAGGFQLGLQFHFIREFDQELLVHQVLARQSMLLRDRNG